MSDYTGSETLNDIQNALAHYGVKHRSGRYPWGSGEDPYQHDGYGTWYKRVKEYKALGLSEKDICQLMDISSTSDLRTYYALAKNMTKSYDADRARSLVDQGYSKAYIAEKLGYPNESSIRSLLNEDADRRRNMAQKTADILRSELETKGMIDVSKGVATSMGVSEAKFKEALTILEGEGYGRFGVGVKQVTNTSQQTNTEVLAVPGKDVAYAYKHLDEIQPVGDIYSQDGGDTFRTGFRYPESLDSKRLQIKYAEDGGIEKDGLIELRRGVADIDLGEGVRYAQVRIMVDGTHYLKGMAAYADDLPDGVDVRFNTNKTKDKPMEKVLKEIKDDPENPFGTTIKTNGQSTYIGEDGKEHLSLINKKNDQGDWTEWADKLPSQFLAKQSKELAKKQLDLSMETYQNEYDTIMSLTNPAVKRKLLLDLADTLDGNAVSLKAASLPRQKWHVILPMESLKEDEIYAPQYENGEKVALIRYPHGSTSEIPILTVNNRNREGRNMIGADAIDAVGIRAKAAERLSGADFDGDTVMVIPTHNGHIKISSTDQLKELENFDPKIAYSTEGKTGVKLMQKQNVQKEMGSISNLIMDMQLKGAGDDEMAKALKHSMVVIDAHKHELDYKQSEIDNDIKALHAKWQGHVDPETGKYGEGAGTLLTRAKSQISVRKREGQKHIDPETGEWIYKETTQQKWDPKTKGPAFDKEGNPIYKTQKSTKMAETKDARTLSTGTVMEELYADYANFQKNLANECRKNSTVAKAGRIEKNAAAAATYKTEVDELEAGLRLAIANKPRERAAQRMASVKVNAQLDENPEMDKEHQRKLRQKALTEARVVSGASRYQIKITDRQWEAIQNGAISDSKATEIFQFADMDDVRQKAMPKERKTITAAQKSTMKSRIAAGYTIAEVAKSMGLSASTVSKYLNE